MGIIGLLLIVSMCVALVFLGAFIWNVKSGQYEDDYSPAYRIFFEDEIVKKNASTNASKQEKNKIKN
ncbi:MAG: cbb3-type cytochrome oxidase assembly protein CcoS [Brumimicrobium sp.]|nr:cbb3-type cytochrome oxidase assembly protein CcoS [Brumimicrobium sp.]MCO5268062.1 cbb3-type cytochrome oxidase assembly protein CcoS [Brumimicrobium sp.]